ncbi:unnamed protein product [Brassica rapa subsp. trilocularis]
MLLFNAASSTSPTLLAKPSSQFPFSNSITTLAILAGPLLLFFCVDSRPSCWLSQHAVDGGCGREPNLSWWRLLLTQKYLELDWPFDSGRKKTYLSQERGQRTPKYSDRLWKKKVESWCKAVERTFDRILETSWERQQCMWLYACGRFVKTDDFRLIILQEGLYQSCYKKPPMPFFTLFGIEDAEHYVVVAFNELKVFARVRSITNQYKRTIFLYIFSFQLFNIVPELCDMYWICRSGFSFRTKYMLTIHVLQIQVPWIVPFCGLRQRDDETHQKEATIPQTPT